MEPVPALSPGDTAWMMTSTALVLMMTLPGLALFYAGLVRSKNALSLFMQCMVSAGVAGVLWVLFGYSLAFGEGNAFFGDLSMLGLAGITADSLSGTIPTYVCQRLDRACRIELRVGLREVACKFFKFLAVAGDQRR
jgi:Amt family ammonium transporter